MKLTINVRSMSIAALLAVLTLSAPALARGDDRSSTSNSGPGNNNTTVSTEQEAESEHGTETEVEHSTQTSDDSRRSIQTKIEDRKAELKTAIQEKREAIKTKLEATRLKNCQAHEEKINTVVQNSKSRAQRVLERLQNVELKVREFYQTKNLAVANYDALSSAVDEKEAAAIAAISVTEETQFSCSEDDASRPGGIISDTVKTQNSSLKAYRDALRDMIKAIKEAAKSTETSEQEETNS